MNLNVSGVHTVFLPSASTSSSIASKYIRDIARFGGDVSSMVPATGRGDGSGAVLAAMTMYDDEGARAAEADAGR